MPCVAVFVCGSHTAAEAVDMNGRFQMQGGKNWILPKYINANRFFWDSHWLEIRARICKSLWSPGIDSEESMPLGHVA
jgi:hypothetical protein